MDCPICKLPYGRGPGFHHVGPGGCLKRVLDFLGLEFPAFRLEATLADGTPFVLEKQK